MQTKEQQNQPKPVIQTYSNDIHIGESIKRNYKVKVGSSATELFPNSADQITK